MIAAFMLGVIIGFAGGMLLTCLFVIARESDREAAKIWRKYAEIRKRD